MIVQACGTTPNRTSGPARIDALAREYRPARGLLFRGIAMVRISRALVINTLCCGIGACVGIDAIYIMRYWHVVVSLYWEAVGCLRLF